MLITGRSPPQVSKYSALKPSNENSNTGDLVNLNKQKLNIKRQTLRNSFLSLISRKLLPDSGNVHHGAISQAKDLVLSRKLCWHSGEQTSSLCSKVGRAIHTQRGWGLQQDMHRIKSHDKAWFQTHLWDEEQAKMLRWSVCWVWYSSWNQSHWSNTQPLQPRSPTPS